MIAPASSANLGPGFDALGLALDLPFTFEVDDADDAGELLVCDETHPATVAYRAAGGRSSELRWRSPIPPGRGLGFSGAARAAGAFAGRLEAGADESRARLEALAIACELERHPDNAGASMLGGFVVSAGERSIRVPLAAELEVGVWWPDVETSTERARTLLPEHVPFTDAVFNVGRSSLLVAALATGDLDALATATQDRLHTDVRLAAAPASRPAIEAFAATSPLAVWLSGSGPTVAALVRRGDGERIAPSAPDGGHVRILAIDLQGARVDS